MMESPALVAISALIVGATIWVSWTWATSRALRPFPPGPKPRPIIGNLFDLPQEHAAKRYSDWEKKYNSKILHASSLGTHILVLNKLEDAIELLETRSYKYSDRPYSPIIDMVGLNGHVALMQYGNFWRLHKKVCQQNLREKASQLYYPIQLQKVRHFLKNLLETPDDFQRHNKLLSVGIPLATMYGYDLEGVDDPYITAADESAFLVGQLLRPGGSLINVFPLLRHIPAWFPGAVSRRIAERARQLITETMRIPMDDLKKRMAERPVPPSLVSSFLERKNAGMASDEEEEVIKGVAYTIYAGASDTTISATSTFFYLMATHPDVQRKAQEELDRVVGFSHLPSFEDRHQMPYVDGIYREILRLHPPLGLGVAHVLTTDDHYKGYFIPKGTIVFANIWAMNHDEEVYEHPSKFMPERFLDNSGALTKDHRALAYGFGRRICVGKHVASSSMWLIIASVLAAFEISQAKDENGNEILIDDEYQDENGFTQHKAPFRCSITPRSYRVKDLLSE
ncbi:hypothetical protein HYPSUDRAFT_48854 [Hypholoma sublateritium FD-334 SS-4]|uniref:Cytochrome P450 n=1 Tax=Hypholoma sublateritium (strain FD-334 SS-4) TaxID=945553 RepID=A0A0D2N6R4_HYPSF|nr:hypothetical protein HYPSUDRAFT_48854 [Hypholoma sublateritium FD-334 SS-4]